MTRGSFDTSPVWDYFTKVDATKAQCKLCKSLNIETIMSRASGQTTSLATHLKAAHEVVYKEYLKKSEQKKRKLEDNKKKCDEEAKKMKTQASNFFRRRSSSVGSIENVEEQVSSSTNLRSDASKSMETLPTLIGAWKQDGPKTLRTNRLILEMIVQDLLPFNHVENTGFRNLIKFLAPAYDMPHRNYFSTKELEACYDEVFAHVKKEISLADFISFTTDGWTASNMKTAILALTAHLLSDQMEPKYRSYVLAAPPLKERHTAENMAKELEKVMQLYEIDKDKVVLVLRDGHTAMIKMASLLEFASFHCFLHIINLCVNDGLYEQETIKKLLEKCKKLVRKVRKSPTLRRDLKAAQKLMELPEHVLIKNTEIRWNSSYEMLNRLEEQRDAVDALCLQHDKLPFILSEEWNVIQMLTQILKPFYDTTIQLQSRNEGISAVVPTYVSLLFTLEVNLATAGLSQMRNKIVAGLKKRMNGWDNNKYLLLSTMLDPRYKLDFFKDKVVKERAKQMLVSEAETMAISIYGMPEEESFDQTVPEISSSFYSMLEAFRTNVDADNPIVSRSSNLNADNPIAPGSSNSNPLSCNPSSVEKINPIEKAHVVIAEYLSTKCISITSNPYKFWQKAPENWKILTKLAKKYLCPPLSTVESERLFSIAGQIMTPLRSLLGDDKLEKLLFLHYNLPKCNNTY